VDIADVIALDEAAAALEAEALSAWKGDKPRILAGDPQQLPPPVFSEGVKDTNDNLANEFYQQLGLSLLKRLDNNGWPC
jgi:superfamily I DNA and/or RNA helicase